ncbi:MAG: CatB-related O-acetyltransferase [Clostridiales bacterium]|nr:CatB-related O-acetyltransferase [Clostridiales bacterium]
MGAKTLVLIYKHSMGIFRKLIMWLFFRSLKARAFSQALRQIYKNVYGIAVGNGTYGVEHQPDNFPPGTRIGNYCSIAPHVRFLSREHAFETASTSPLFTSKLFGFRNNDKYAYADKTIGHDVWIGQYVLLTKKCTQVGNGSIIGGGAIVTRDVPPYVVVAGNPAKIIRHRFEQDVIDALEESKWWELPPDVLYSFEAFVENPKSFAQQIIMYRFNR